MTAITLAVGCVAILLGLVVATDKRDSPRSHRPRRPRAPVEVHAVWATAWMFTAWLLWR